MTLHLTGNLQSDVGSEPRIKLTSWLYDFDGPGIESCLCKQYPDNIEINQNGTSICPPKKGPVQMTYSVKIPYWYMKKGNYSVRAELYATDGSRMTDFEGTVFINGETGDGKDGW